MPPKYGQKPLLYPQVPWKSVVPLDYLGPDTIPSQPTGNVLFVIQPNHGERLLTSTAFPKHCCYTQGSTCA